MCAIFQVEKKKVPVKPKKNQIYFKKRSKKEFFLFLFFFSNPILCVWPSSFTEQKPISSFDVDAVYIFDIISLNHELKRGIIEKRKRKNLKTLLYNFVLGLVSSRVSLSVMLQILPQVRDKKDQSPASLSMQSP